MKKKRNERILFSSTNAQSTTEYLVMIAVVLVLALTVVVVIFNSTSKSDTDVISSVRLSMKSGAIGFAELAGDFNGDMIGELLNNTGQLVYIEVISLVGKNRDYARHYSDIKVDSGGREVFFLDSFPECKCTVPGATRICDFNVQYQTENGLVKNFSLKAVVDCVTKINSGGAVTPVCKSENSPCAIGSECCGRTCTLGLCAAYSDTTTNPDTSTDTDQPCVENCDELPPDGEKPPTEFSECITNSDCVDNRSCTVDTCVLGNCINNDTLCSPVTVLPTNIITITTCAELRDLNGLDLNYVLENDINCASISNFVPIGDSNTPFTGMFDGNNHTISNLNIAPIYSGFVDENTIVDNFGLFGSIYDAQISNISISASSVTGSYAVGMVAGDANKSTISNCVIDANIKGVNYVSGIFGYSEDSNISNCSVLGNVSSAYFANVLPVNEPYFIYYADGAPKFAGAVAGYFVDGNISDVNSYITLFGVSRVGGVAGSFLNSTISNSYSFATVNGIHSVGGFFGFTSNSDINSVHFDGNVKGIIKVGGIAGVQLNGSVSSSTSNVDIIGTKQVAPISGKIIGGTLVSTFATGVGYLQMSDDNVNSTSLENYLNSPVNVDELANFETYLSSSQCPSCTTSVVFGNLSYSNPRVIMDCNDLQNINQNLDGNYYLAQDLNCSETISWNGGNGFAPVGQCGTKNVCNKGNAPDENYTPFTGSLRGEAKITDINSNRPDLYNTGVFGCSTSSDIIPTLLSPTLISSTFLASNVSNGIVACDYSSIDPETQAIGSWWNYAFGNTPWFVYKWYWSGYPSWWQWPGAGYAYWDWGYWNNFSSWYRGYDYGSNVYCGGSYLHTDGALGTLTNPIKIYDCQGLQSIANDLDANYKLAQDIDCTGFNFVPIGTVGYCNSDGNTGGVGQMTCAYIGSTSCQAVPSCYTEFCTPDDCANPANVWCWSEGCASTWNTEAPFVGSINGGGYIIRNLVVDRNYVNKQHYIGMIGYGKNATLRNLKFVGASVTGSPSNLPGTGGFESMPSFGVGVVAGGCQGCSVINVSVDGSVVLSLSSNYFGAAAGLIMGYSNASAYYNLFSSGSVTLSETAGASASTPESGAGGLIGASRNESITRAGSTADVSYTMTSTNDWLQGYVGGLIGTAYSSNLYRGYHVGDVTGSVSGCSLDGDYAYGCMFAGGIMGGRYDTSDYPPGGLVSTSYNIGNVTGDLAGALAGSGSVTYSYADGNVIGGFGAATTSGALYGYGAQYVYTRVTVTAPRKAGVSPIRCQPACSGSHYIYWDSGLFSNPDLCPAGCGGQDYNGEGYMLTSSQLRDKAVMPSAFSSGEFCMCSGDYPRLAWETGVDPTCDCAKPITNCTDLQNMNQFPKAKFYLVDNLDCDNFNWNNNNVFVPVGDYAAPFMGDFNGNGKTISNLRIGKTPNNEYAGSPFTGLFGIVVGAKIHDLTIHFADINVPYYRIGGAVVGYGEDVNITNVHVDGNVYQTNKSLYGCGYNDWPSIGGLVGKGSGLITNSSFNGMVWDRGTNLGGAYGGLAGIFLGPIINSNTQGYVSSPINYAGGLVGYYSNYYNTYTSGITNSYSLMDVNGTTAGGLVGELVSGTISNSYYVGEITCASWGSCGGLIGKTGNQNYLSYSNYPRITSSYADSNILGNNSSSIGGLVGSHYGYYSWNYGWDWGNFKITDSNFSGTIQGAEDAGGIIGTYQAKHSTEAMTNLKVNANISGTRNVGGIAGDLRTSPYVLIKDAPWWPSGFRLNSNYSLYSNKYWYSLLENDENESINISTYHVEGYNAGTIQVSGLEFTGNLSTTLNYWANVGGLFGFASNLSASESKSSGTINRSRSYINSGGLFGELKNSYINLCASSINFTDNNSEKNNNLSGGFVGKINNSAIGQSYYSGDLNYSKSDALWAAGAFAGISTYSSVSASLFVGQNSGGQQVRPIGVWFSTCGDYECYSTSVYTIYWDSSQINIQNDYCAYAQQKNSRWYRMTSSECYGMSALTTVAAKQQASYSALAFTPSYWSICEGVSYPWLSWEGQTC